MFCNYKEIILKKIINLMLGDYDEDSFRLIFTNNLFPLGELLINIQGVFKKSRPFEVAANSN